MKLMERWASTCRDPALLGSTSAVEVAVKRKPSSNLLQYDFSRLLLPLSSSFYSIYKPALGLS